MQFNLAVGEAGMAWVDILLMIFMAILTALIVFFAIYYKIR